VALGAAVATALPVAPASAAPVTPAAPVPPAPAAAGAASGAVVPTQFVAKAYTELLGRAPTPAEWDRATTWFETHGCSTASLEAFGLGLVSSAEYARDYDSHGLDTPAIALTLFRFVLNREPDPDGFVEVRDAMDFGVTPRAEAAALFGSAEFRIHTEPAICSPDFPSYGFGEPGNPTEYQAITTPTRGAPGPMLSEQLLELLLIEASRRPHGGTVTLPARTVVGLSTSLTVPSGVTLTTAGDPGPRQYASMARLVRLPTYTYPSGTIGLQLVTVLPGAHLVHVWVDGQRDQSSPDQFANFDVVMVGGTGTVVADDRIGNTDGASTLEDLGGSMTARPAPACADNLIAGNLIEAYSSAHVAFGTVYPYDHPQADGIGDYCEGARIVDNDLVDISDTAIVLFDGAPLVPTAHPQTSVVEHNTIVSAGNSMSFAISTDPGYSLDFALVPGGDPPGKTTRSFRDRTGRALIEDNTIWTGPRTHVDVVLNEGTHDLFGSTIHPNCLLPDTADLAACGGGRNALGALWKDNTSGGIGVSAEMGIYVGGTVGSVFEGNRLVPYRVAVGVGPCPRHPVVVASGHGPASDFATGLRIDEPVWRDRTLRSDSCVTPAF
jgi:hypothetical protein